MIASLRGTIIFRGMNRIIVDVSGVGYEVGVSLQTLESLPVEGEVFLHVHTALRENSLELFGFSDPAEKRLFEMLIAVAGIGPKSSLTILSGIAPDAFREAVLSEDLDKLTSIPGIGRKSAERLVVELKEKILKLSCLKLSSKKEDRAASLEEDLVSSLVNLGYKEGIASSAAKKVLKKADPGVDPAQAVKMALKELMK